MYSFFCKKPCNKYGHLCTKPKGHQGSCSHTFVSRLIKKNDEAIGRKLATDSYQTPGDKGVVKNRADRCFPIQYTKQQIYEANKKNLKGLCIQKRFSSTPRDCFELNIQLATQIISIKDFKLSNWKEDCDDEIETLLYLRKLSQQSYPGKLRCRICNECIVKDNFYTDHLDSGGNSVQLGHIEPHINGEDDTAHVSGNAQWIHRDCNIIQGEKTEAETFEALAKILTNQGYTILKKSEVKCG